MTDILMVDGSDRGGIAIYTARLIEDLLARDVDVVLAAPGQRGDLDFPRMSWGDALDGRSRAQVRLEQVAGWSRRAARLVRLVRRLRPRVVHIQTPTLGPLEPVFLRWCRRRAAIVRTIHDVTPHDDTRQTRREPLLWSLCDHLIVHGADDVPTASQAGRPVTTIPVDLLGEAGPADPDRRIAARRGLGLGDEPVVLLLGLVRPYKGIGLMADAWPAVRAAVPDATLVVAGSVLAPFADLDRLVQLPGVDARFSWLSDDDVDRWAAAADVCLLPYRHGTHSGVLHRAVVAGTPVIVGPSLADEARALQAGPSVDLDADAWSEAVHRALVDPLPVPVAPHRGAQAAATMALYDDLRRPS